MSLLCQYIFNKQCHASMASSKVLKDSTPKSLTSRKMLSPQRFGRSNSSGLKHNLISIVTL